MHDRGDAPCLSVPIRNTALGDPAFVENPVAKLVDKTTRKKSAAKIDPSRPAFPRS